MVKEWCKRRMLVMHHLSLSVRLRYAKSLCPRETVCDTSYGNHTEFSEQSRIRIMEKERGYSNGTHQNSQPLKRREQLTFIQPTDALTCWHRGKVRASLIFLACEWKEPWIESEGRIDRKEMEGSRKKICRQMERQQPWVAVTEIVLLYLKTTGVC